jgi:hypothetical protein
VALEIAGRARATPPRPHSLRTSAAVCRSASGVGGEVIAQEGVDHLQIVASPATTLDGRAVQPIVEGALRSSRARRLSRARALAPPRRRRRVADVVKGIDAALQPLRVVEASTSSISRIVRPTARRHQLVIKARKSCGVTSP